MMSENEKRALEHAMNCPHRSLAPEDPCTCGLEFRKQRDEALAELRFLREWHDKGNLGNRLCSCQPCERAKVILAKYPDHGTPWAVQPDGSKIQLSPESMP